MNEHDNLIERGKRALARLNAADKEFNEAWRRMGYDSTRVGKPVTRKPVRRRAKRRT